MKKFYYSGQKRSRIIENEQACEHLDLINRINSLQTEINNLMKINEERNKVIHTLREEKKQYEKKNEILFETIIKLREDKKKLLVANQYLEDIITINKKDNKNLTNKLEETKPIYLACKLRKMLKKILEYIINDPDLSPALRIIKNKTYFLRVPMKFFSLNYKINDIIGALNKLLRIIFYYSSDFDYKIHFAQKESIFNKNLRKRIPVFNHYQDFFDYFEIDELYENILINLIPNDLFTTIDNYSFEKGIPYLLSKIEY